VLAPLGEYGPQGVHGTVLDNERYVRELLVVHELLHVVEVAGADLDHGAGRVAAGRVDRMGLDETRYFRLHVSERERSGFMRNRP